MARSLTDLCDDIIYEAGNPHLRPYRIKSLAREIKRKFADLNEVREGPDPAQCTHPQWALTPLTTGDGTPVSFCNLCKTNQLV